MCRLSTLLLGGGEPREQPVGTRDTVSGTMISAVLVVGDDCLVARAACASYGVTRKDTRSLNARLAT